MFALLIAAAALAAAAPETAVEDPQAALADLQQVYQQSCDNRAYGSYNDMCAEMRRQIRDYQREAAAQRRAHRSGAASAPIPQPVGAPAPPPLGAPAPPP